MNYLENLKNELIVRGYSKKTQEQYLLYISDFIEYCKDKGFALESLTKENITSYLAHKKEQNLRNTSLAMIFAAIHFFVKEIIRSNACDEIKTPKKEKYLPTVLTKEEIKALIDSAENKRDKLIIELLYSSGLRVSELCNLKLENIDINEKLLKVKGGKGNKDRLVVLSEKWITVYVDFAKKFFKKVQKEYVFCKHNGKPLSSDTIQRIIKESAKRANITKHVSPHTMRHSYATHLLQAGTNLREIQTLLGHSNIATTQIYTKVDTKELKKIKSPFDVL